MGNFRSERREGGFRGGRSGGFRGGDRGRSGGRGGFGGRRERPEMHDVVCDKCGSDCQVPFRPTGDKPVLCSNCFRKEGDSGSSPRRSFSSNSRGSNSNPNQAGISQEQYKEINKKLDKILGILDMIEFEEEAEDEEGDELVEDDEESDEKEAKDSD